MILLDFGLHASEAIFCALLFLPNPLCLQPLCRARVCARAGQNPPSAMAFESQKAEAFGVRFCVS